MVCWNLIQTPRGNDKVVPLGCHIEVEKTLERRPLSLWSCRIEGGNIEDTIGIDAKGGGRHEGQGIFGEFEFEYFAVLVDLDEGAGWLSECVDKISDLLVCYGGVMLRKITCYVEKNNRRHDSGFNTQGQESALRSEYRVFSQVSSVVRRRGGLDSSRVRDGIGLMLLLQ